LVAALSGCVSKFGVVALLKVTGSPIQDATEAIEFVAKESPTFCESSLSIEKVTLVLLPPASEKDEESERLLELAFLALFDRESDERRGLVWIGVKLGLFIPSPLPLSEAKGREESDPLSNRTGDLSYFRLL